MALLSEALASPPTSVGFPAHAGFGLRAAVRAVLAKTSLVAEATERVNDTGRARGGFTGLTRVKGQCPLSGFTTSFTSLDGL